MRVTQTDIARRARLDVSSVNKILNRTPGPKFLPATVKRVLRIARELGYDFGRATKGTLGRDLQAAKEAGGALLLAAREARRALEAGEVLYRDGSADRGLERLLAAAVEKAEKAGLVA
jgi:DNA-binding LacI/PurR family transcriptional regulator